MDTIRCVLVTARSVPRRGGERACGPGSPRRLSRSCQLTRAPIAHAPATMADPRTGGAPWPKDEATSTRKPGTIVVGGTGRVAVEPDVADLRLGVSVARPTVDAARSDAAAADDRRSSPRCERAGVAERDVRTTLLSVQPRYDYRDGKAAGPHRLRPRRTSSRSPSATWPRSAASSTARCGPAPRAWTGCRSASRTRARPSARPGSRRSPRRERGRRSWPRRPGVAHRRRRGHRRGRRARPATRSRRPRG